MPQPDASLLPVCRTGRRDHAAGRWRPPVPVLPPRDNHVQSESNERGSGKRARENEANIRSPAPAGPQPLIYEGAPSLPPAPSATGSARLEANAATSSPKGCDPICYGFFSSNTSPQSTAGTPSTAHEKRTSAAAGPEKDNDVRKERVEERADSERKGRESRAGGPEEASEEGEREGKEGQGESPFCRGA